MFRYSAYRLAFIRATFNASRRLLAVDFANIHFVCGLLVLGKRLWEVYIADLKCMLRWERLE
jgi:hypothetical protein